MQKVNNKCKEYLEYIRGLDCLVGLPGCSGYRVDPHHVIQGKETKKNDFYAVPLCRRCHSQLENVGKFRFFREGNIDIDKKIIDLLIDYIKGLNENK